MVKGDAGISHPPTDNHMCTNPYFRIYFYETYPKTLGTRSGPRKLTLRMGLLPDRGP